MRIRTEFMHSQKMRIPLGLISGAKKDFQKLQLNKVE